MLPQDVTANASNLLTPQRRRAASTHAGYGERQLLQPKQMGPLHTYAYQTGLWGLNIKLSKVVLSSLPGLGDGIVQDLCWHAVPLSMGTTRSLSP